MPMVERRGDVLRHWTNPAVQYSEGQLRDLQQVGAKVRSTPNSLMPKPPDDAKTEDSSASRPKALSAAVSRQMSRMPTASTEPELALRRTLHARGLRFRLHRRDLPGTPDIVFPRARVAVFVDGCFWHGCPEHGVLPKNNREWWIEKLTKTAERDRRKDEELVQLGWTPIHLWEHELVDCMADKVQALLQPDSH